MPRKIRSIKNNGTYVFSDFSEGLYLLDTPRTLGEQLASLALKGGRNIRSEKGSLVPQYGYINNAQIVDDRVVAYTKDDQNGSTFFLVTLSGAVYLYTAAQGLKKYKTALDAVADTPVVTRRGDDLVIYTGGAFNLFGGAYDESATVAIDEDITLSTFSSFYRFTTSLDSLDYYWNGKQVYINEDKLVTITSVDEISCGYTQVSSSDISGYASNYEMDITFPVLNKYLKGESYTVLATPEGDGTQDKAFNILVTSNSNGTFNLSISIRVYDTVLGLTTDTWYTTKTNEIKDLYPDNYIVKVIFDTNNKLVLTLTNSDGNVIYTEESGERYQFAPIGNSASTCPMPVGFYILSDGENIYESEDGVLFYKDGVVLTPTKNPNVVRITIVPDDGEMVNYTDNVAINEKALNPIGSLVYSAEETGTEYDQHSITPSVMGIASNRLLISEADGTIFYSQIGVIAGDNAFKESYGAGFFKGYYNDTSKTLSIEDYMSGALIAKETGLYYLRFTNANNQDSVSNSSSIGITVTKIAQLGQQYASDHIIVKEKVYAYDSNSGSLINAIQQNIFGSLTSGKVLVPSDYLDANLQGIQDTQRFLTYNAENGVFILYYGEQLTHGIVVVASEGTMFPRELDIPMLGFLGFNQGVAGISDTGIIIQDFKKGTVIEGLSAVAEFEPIGLRDNRFICSTILEVTELNGIEYTLTIRNSGTSYQVIHPNSELSADMELLAPFIYSNYTTNSIYESYELTSKWANKQSNITRVGAPMSGREGVQISIEFPANQAFCLSALRLPDFSQGE